MAAEQTISDGNTSLGSFGNHPAAVAVHSVAFRVGQDNRIRFTGRLQRWRPMGRIWETEMFHASRDSRLWEEIIIIINNRRGGLNCNRRLIEIYRISRITRFDVRSVKMLMTVVK